VVAVGWLLVLAGLVPQAALAAPAAPPAPSGYVTDKVGVLDSGAAAAMNSSLQGFDQQTSNQVVVWIDNDLPSGQTIDSFAQDAFNAWRIGQKDHNNGVLFVVFVRSRLTRIEVGAGLTGVLPDTAAVSILNGQVLPRFRSGDFTGGVSAGLTAITGATRGTFAAPIFPVTVPGAATSPHHGNTGVILPVAVGLFVLIALGMAFGGRRRHAGAGYWGAHPYYYNNGGYFGGARYDDDRGASPGSSGSGFSGGGFSGGGGSTGGGGATGGW
jgi:uncharacterized protein